MKRLLTVLVVVIAVIVLIVWGVSRRNQSTDSTATPAPTQEMTPTTSNSPSVSDNELVTAADVVLRLYFASPVVDAVTPANLNRYATAPFLDSLEGQWDGLSGGTSVTVSQISYPLAPREQEDGTITLVAYVETITKYGDSSSKESYASTAIMTFVPKDGVWLIDAIEEINGYAGKEGD